MSLATLARAWSKPRDHEGKVEDLLGECGEQLSSSSMFPRACGVAEVATLATFTLGVDLARHYVLDRGRPTSSPAPLLPLGLPELLGLATRVHAEALAADELIERRRNRLYQPISPEGTLARALIVRHAVRHYAVLARSLSPAARWFYDVAPEEWEAHGPAKRSGFPPDERLESMATAAKVSTDDLKWRARTASGGAGSLVLADPLLGLVPYEAIPSVPKEELEGLGFLVPEPDDFSLDTVAAHAAGSDVLQCLLEAMRVAHELPLELPE